MQSVEKSVMTLLSDPDFNADIYNSSYETVSVAQALNGCFYTVFYFGSDKSLSFTHELIQTFFEANCSTSHRIQVFYIGCELSYEAYRTHVKQMPWPIFAFGSLLGKRLTKIFNATQAPSAAIVETHSGRVVSDRGVELIQRHGASVFKKFERMVDFDNYNQAYERKEPLLAN